MKTLGVNWMVNPEYFQSRLLIIRTVGILWRWVRRRVKEASDGELLATESELMTLSSKASHSEKVPSLSKTYKHWSNHPLNNILFEERVRRERSKESEDPAGYFGDLFPLSLTDIQDYLFWKAERHGSIEDWRKDKRRTLKVVTQTNTKGNSNEKEETEKDNRHLPSSGVRNFLQGLNRKSSSEGSTTQAQEARAYGPGRKRTKTQEGSG